MKLLSSSQKRQERHTAQNGSEVNLFYTQKTKARIDIDNRLKGLLDAMQKAYLYADDEQFDEITIRRGSVIKGGNVEVRIWEI